MLFFYVAPPFSWPETIRRLKVLTSGEVFSLNRFTGLIERNGECLAPFSDVERVQIGTIYSSEGSNEYRLSIVLKNEEKLRIDQSTESEEITAVAEDIADLFEVAVTRKDRRRLFNLDLGGG